MSKLPEKLLVCDLDGTLLDNNGAIDETSLSRIKTFCQEGGHFVVCTGRMDTDIQFIEDKLGFQSEFRISQNGAVIKDVKDQIVALHTIPTEYIPTLNQIIFAHDLRTEVSNPTNRLFPSPRDPENVAEFVDSSRVIPDLADYVLNEKQPTIYLTFGTAAEFASIRQEIEAALGKDTLNIVMTSPSSLEVFSKEASKGIALAQIQTLLGIKPADTYVAGDAESDVPMFAYADHAFAVQAAAADIRQKAGNYAATVGVIVEKIYQEV